MPQAAKIEVAPEERRHLTEDLPRLRWALVESGGNITHAAAALEVTKPYLMALVKKFGLNTWARELRAARGAPATGRPRALI